ncbi:MAG TPA: hypothetical protein VNO30_03345 [Kofleriaceae bacterium]|nr:hypothetical protein [Kofleriaceae bacterium]
MADHPPFALAWLRQREHGAAAVVAIEAEELRQLDADEALCLSDALLEATPLEAVDPRRRTWSGLVEQQRLFARARR